MEEKKNSWSGIKIMINGIEVQGIKPTNHIRKLPLHVLKFQLKVAEEKEEYELCAELKKRIDNYIE